MLFSPSGFVHIACWMKGFFLMRDNQAVIKALIMVQHCSITELVLGQALDERA